MQNTYELQEAILNQIALNNQTNAIIITAQFTLFFGYFSALFLFLQRTSVMVRVIAFLFFALSNGFLIVGQFSMFQVHQRSLDWHAELVRTDMLPDYFSEQAIAGAQLFWSVAEASYYLLTLGATVFLIYITFIHDWSSETKPKPENDARE